MAWRIEEDEEQRFVELSYTGQLTLQDARDSTTAAIDLAIREGLTLFLADISGAEARLSIFDIYSFPDQWAEAGANRNMRMALVGPGGAISGEDARFYENVAVTDGWDVRVFNARREALDWLLDR